MTKEDEKALECIKYLKQYTSSILCGACALSKICPCKHGERCPSLWDCEK